MKKTVTTFLILLFGIVLVSCKQETYTITFDTDGGGIVHDLEIAKNKLVIRPADPEKEGYEFLYWVNQETNEKFDFLKYKVTDKLSLKAIYRQYESYQVTFDYNFDDQEEIEIVAENKLVKKAPPIERFGYTIIDWTLDGESFDFKTPITKDIVLKAVWEAKEGSELLEDINYNPVLESVVDLKLDLNIPELKLYSQGKQRIEVKNLNLLLEAKADLRDENNYLVDFNLKIGIEQIKMSLLTYKNFDLTQSIYIKDNHVYSMFNGLYDKGSFDEFLRAVIPLLSLGTIIGQEVPDEVMVIIEKIVPVFTNYEEYQENVIDGELTDQISNIVDNLGSIIEMLLNNGILDDVDIDFVNGEDRINVSINEKVEGLIINELLLSLIRNKNLFDSIIAKFDLELKIPFPTEEETSDDAFNDGIITSGIGSLSLTTNNEDFIITTDLSTYQKVDELRITKAIDDKYYLVTLEVGEGIDNPRPLYVLDGQKIVLPTGSISKPEHKFLYWTYQGEELNLDMIIDQDITLVAKWEVIPHVDFIFDTDGGSEVKPSRVEVGKTIRKPLTNPTKPGYKFLYWEFMGKEFDFTTVITEATTVKAVWEKLDEDAIIKIDYSEFLTKNLTGGASLTIDEYRYKVGMDEILIKNLRFTLSYRLDLIKYEVAYGNLKLTVLSGDVFFNDELVGLKLNLVQDFYLKNGNLYSSLVGKYTNLDNEELALAELFNQLKLDNFLPDHQEYLENVLTLDLYEKFASYTKDITKLIDDYNLADYLDMNKFDIIFNSDAYTILLGNLLNDKIADASFKITVKKEIASRFDFAITLKKFDAKTTIYIYTTTLKPTMVELDDFVKVDKLLISNFIDINN